MNGAPTEELVNALNDAFNSNDVSAIMPYFAEDARFDATRGPDAGGVTHRGRETIARALRALFDGVESVRWEPLDVRIAGDKAYCEYVRKARSKDGEDSEWLTVDVITFRDGLVTRKNSFTKVRSA